jgi:hypothetical protein
MKLMLMKWMGMRMGQRAKKTSTKGKKNISNIAVE